MNALLVVRDTDARYVLCYDLKWRREPDFGSMPGCAKIYRSLGWALRKARRIGGLVYSVDHWHDVCGVRSQRIVCSNTVNWGVNHEVPGHSKR